MSPLLLRLLPYLGGIGFLALLAWYWHHHGYLAGQAERTAYYEPLLAAIDREKAAAEARVKATDAAAARSSKESEDKLRETQKALDARAAAAEQHIGVLLSQLATARRSHEMPSTPGTPADPGPTPEVRRRLGAIAASFSAIGRNAESDAAAFGECQRFYDAQRALQLNPLPGS